MLRINLRNFGILLLLLVGNGVTANIIFIRIGFFGEPLTVFGFKFIEEFPIDGLDSLPDFDDMVHILFPGEIRSRFA